MSVQSPGPLRSFLRCHGIRDFAVAKVKINRCINPKDHMAKYSASDCHSCLKPRDMSKNMAS